MSGTAEANHHATPPPAPAASHIGQFKLWNVPKRDPFVGQGAFVVRTGPHDEIYGEFKSAADQGVPGRTFVMTDHNNAPLYAG